MEEQLTHGLTEHLNTFTTLRHDVVLYWGGVNKLLPCFVLGRLSTGSSVVIPPPMEAAF